MTEQDQRISEANSRQQAESLRFIWSTGGRSQGLSGEQASGWGTVLLRLELSLISRFVRL